MAKIIHIAGPDGACLSRIYAQDDALVPLAVGTKPASSLVACAGATLELAGSTPDGNVSYTSIMGGTVANNIRVAQQPGATGPGNESRPLEVVVSGQDVNVIFGTDADAGTAIPTSAEVAAAVASADGTPVVATAGGDGSGSVGSHAFTNLAGGQNDGDRYKWNVHPPRVDVINMIETV
jgi:hypothetical protein